MRILLYQRLGAGLLVLFFFGPSWQLVISAANRSHHEQGQEEGSWIWRGFQHGWPRACTEPSHDRPEARLRWCCCKGRGGPGAPTYLHVPHAHSSELQQSSSHWNLSSSCFYRCTWHIEGTKDAPVLHANTAGSLLGYEIQRSLDMRLSWDPQLG